MKGTELRSLTTNLWAESEVRFQLEDGTPLMFVMSDKRQNWIPAKDGRKNVKEGSPVPTHPPILTLILRVQNPSPSEMVHTQQSTTPEKSSTSEKSAETEAKEEKKIKSPPEYQPDVDEVPNGT